MTRQELELLLKIRTDGEQSFQKVSAGVGTLTREAQAGQIPRVQ